MGVTTSGFTELAADLEALASGRSPELSAAQERAAGEVRSAIASGAPGSIGATVRLEGMQVTGTGLKATISISHQAAAVMEYGRKTFYRTRSPGKPAGIGNNRGPSKRTAGSLKRGVAFTASPGMLPRPYVGPGLARAEGEVLRILEAGVKQALG